MAIRPLEGYPSAQKYFEENPDHQEVTLIGPGGEEFAYTRKSVEQWAESQGPMPEWLKPEKPNPYALIGGELVDQAQGVKQTALSAGEMIGAADEGDADRYTKEVVPERDFYRKQLKEAGVSEWNPYRLVGKTAPFLALGAAGEAALLKAGVKGAQTLPAWLRMGKAMLAGGAAGGAVGATEFVDPGESRAMNTATGAAVGLVAPPVVKVAAEAAKIPLKYVIGKPFLRLTYGLRKSLQPGMNPKDVGAAVNPILKEYGVSPWENLSPEARNAAIKTSAEWIKKTGKANPKAAARAALLEEMGFKGEAAPTAGQVMRDPGVYTLESDLAKMQAGRPVLDRKMAQSVRLFDIITEQGQKTGLTRDSAEGAARKVMKAVEDQYMASKKVVDGLYDEARKSSLYEAPVALDRAKNLLLGWTKNKEDELVPEINTLMAMMGDDSLAMKLSTSESVRQKASALYGTASPRSKGYLMKFMDTLDGDVIDSVGTDIHKAARAAYRARRVAFENELLEDAMDPSANANTFLETRIIKGDTNDVKAIRKTFMEPMELLEGEALEAAKAEGKMAWDTIRGQTWNYLMDKSVTVDKDTGMALFKADAFEKALKTLGDRAEVIFSKEELQTIRAIGNTGRWLMKAPMHSSENYSNTGRFMQDHLRSALRAAQISQGTPGGTLLSALPQAARDVTTTRAIKTVLESKAPDYLKQAADAWYNAAWGKMEVPFSGILAKFRKDLPTGAVKKMFNPESDGR